MKSTWFFVIISFAYCTCQETNDTRCSIYDNECQKNYFQDIARNRAHTGIPEVGIPVIDPFKLTNVVLKILGLVKLTLVDGEAVGIGKCIVTYFETNVTGRYRQPEMICNRITIRGHYKIDSEPVVGKHCAWCNLNGEGNGTIVIDDWFFKFRYPFRMVRKENGQIYMDAMFDKAVYAASVKKVTVTADCIMNGNRDITREVVSFINNNWKLLMASEIGKFINDKSAEYYYDIYKIFFTNAPANTYLNDDLTPLLEN